MSSAAEVALKFKVWPLLRKTSLAAPENPNIHKQSTSTATSRINERLAETHVQVNNTRPHLPHLNTVVARFASAWNLPNATNDRLQNFCGPLDQNIRQIETALSVRVKRRADHFELAGMRSAVEQASQFFDLLQLRANSTIAAEDLQLLLVDFSEQSRMQASVAENHASRAHETSAHKSLKALEVKENEFNQTELNAADSVTVEATPTLQTRRSDLAGRTNNQRQYIRNIQSHDICFGIGPAGTGKTYLAVACAVDALERDLVKRIVLTRPAVEAGERLGFLPGDLSQKVDPYLRPLYDALYDLLGFERTAKLFERNVIEIAPLAYMRGRTLNHAFVILDEAQNTTPEQMKMFLTRLGFGSKAVITGDVTQVDLPKQQKSGLVDARQVLSDVRGICFCKFNSGDVVRHPLVAKIVDAYESGILTPEEP
jgi:phosphate starvation-inducible protein PhoH and related proteins